MNKFNIIDFDNELKVINQEITETANNLNRTISNKNKMENELNELLRRIENIAEKSGIEIEKYNCVDNKLELFNLNIDSYLSGCNNFKKENIKKFPQLSNIDIIVCSVSSILSILIDVIFVGTPEVIKIYRGGENFEGSILTELLREIGSSDNSKIAPVLKWFSDKCKVPYDISAYKGTVTPNNHRLRSFAHDPLFGLMFAIADIILGTTTCIDNTGELKILINKTKVTTEEKWFSALYYLGHLISDICTARGLPIPGFCFLEFFQTEIGEQSIAKIVEDMYIDGYDLRHMISMGTPIFINEMIVKMYCKLSEKTTDGIFTIAESEKINLDNKLKVNKMKFITNSAATIGNVIKFIAPPSCGNPNSINLMQWLAFLQSGMVFTKAGLRDMSAEKVIYSREKIDEKWEELLFKYEND